MKNINFEKVLLKIGGVASDTTDYKTVRLTWNSELSRTSECPPFIIFSDTWREMIYSGEEVGDWKDERIKAYIKEGIFIERTNDLLMEYNVAMAAGDLITAEKYQLMIEDIHTKRKAIKEQFPKP